MKLLAKSLLVIGALAVSLAAQGVWTPEAQVKTKAVGAPQISPDGKRIAYTVNEAVMTAERSEFVTQIWLANTDGANAFQVTFGEKSSTNPKWSPDGNWLAFTSNRKDNRNNIYLLRAQGGEAEQITDVKGGISAFEWSPDGNWLAYLMTDAKSEDEEKNEKGRNDFRWVDENPKFSRLYVMPVAKDAMGKREARKLTLENYHVDGLDWSPDGKTIAFSHVKTSGANDWVTSDVSLLDVASGKITLIAKTPAAENAPRFSPDGKGIALNITDNPPRWARHSEINIYSVADGSLKKLATSPDAQPNMVDWSADGKTIWLTEAKGTKTGLYSIDVAANKITEHSETVGVFNVTMSPNRSMFGIVWQSAISPPEIYVSAVNKLVPVQISRVNADLAKMPMPKTGTHPLIL